MQLVLDVEPLEPGRPGAGSSAGRLAITRRDACQATAAAAAGAAAGVAPPGSRSLGFRLTEAGPSFLAGQPEQHIL